MSSLGLVDEDIGVYSIDDNTDKNVYILSEDNIVPKDGLYLGLDISKNSTGITYIENGNRITGNISLEEVEGVHKEVLLRRLLKKYLLEVVEGKDFNAIVIEDAFVGDNAETVRLLFALNTAIDEIILDGYCSCKEFLRVSNQTWKSWLSFLDPSKSMKGYNDKEKVRYYLSTLGIFDEGEGFQDRLDSTGMLIGYFLKIKGYVGTGSISKNKKVRFSDIEGAYDVDQGYLFYGRDDINTDNIEYIDYNRITKGRVIELLTENPDKVFVTVNTVMLGNLGVDLGLDTIGDGGYFAFWIKKNRLKKYIGG